MAHLNLSPRTKCRVREISSFKKGTNRSKRMVMAELMKKAPTPSRTPTKVPGVTENVYPSVGGGYRPFKRTRAEDHVFDNHYGSDDATFRRTYKQKSDYSSAIETNRTTIAEPLLSAPVRELLQQSSLVLEEEPQSPSGNGFFRTLPEHALTRMASPAHQQQLQSSPVREQQHEASPAREQQLQESPARQLQASPARQQQLESSPPREQVLQTSTSPDFEFARLSPVKLASGIARTVPASLQLSPTLSRVPCHRLASQICVQSDSQEQQSPIVEDSRMADTAVCSNLASPPMAHVDQNGGGPSPTNVYGNLLRSVGSAEDSAPDVRDACSPLRLQNGDSDSLSSRQEMQIVPRRAASPELLVLPPAYFHGLYNLGNTCYMNVVIQLLYSLDCFLAAMQVCEQLGLNLPNDGIFRMLKNVFMAMHEAGDHQVIGPSDLQMSCEKYMTDFCGSVQQDAQEFFLSVLDKIDEENAASLERKVAEVPCFPPSKELFCPVNSNFSCQVRNILHCEKCDYVGNVDQTCRHFSLPLPADRRDPEAEVPDIEALLDLYFQVETVSLKCSKCGCESLKSTTKIMQLPRVLVLHINRFEIDSHMLCSKVCVRVSFGKSLDLGKWCSEKVRSAHEEIRFPQAPPNLPNLTDYRDLQNGHAKMNGRIHDSSEQMENGGMHLDKTSSRYGEEKVAAVSTKYNLQGVVSHVGKLASCGHYTVDIFDKDSSKFVRCDDSICREVREEDVFSDEKCAEAYLLLYVLEEGPEHL